MYLPASTVLNRGIVLPRCLQFQDWPVTPVPSLTDAARGIEKVVFVVQANSRDALGKTLERL
jgi:hypothetical protein